MLVLLAALAVASAADTVTLKYVAGAPGPAALRCVGEREKRVGGNVQKNRMDLRAVSSVRKVGENWAVGTERIEVISTEPPPPPGAPPVEAILARVEELMPDTLLDGKGRWVGVEEVPPGGADALLTTFLSGANLPPPVVERFKAALLPTFEPAGTAARLRESWYVYTGHWLDRTLTVGRSEVGEAKAGDPLAAGTTLTWAATRRTTCGGAGPAGCVEVRLDAKAPASEGVTQANALLAGVAAALGRNAADVRVANATVSTTWSSVLDPATLVAWGTERRRVVDAELTIDGQALPVGTSDVFRCAAE